MQIIKQRPRESESFNADSRLQTHVMSWRPAADGTPAPARRPGRHAACWNLLVLVLLSASSPGTRGDTTDGCEGENPGLSSACSAGRQVRDVHVFHYRDPDWMKYYGVEENFGDFLGLAMTERLVGPVVSVSSRCPKPPSTLAYLAHARQLHTIGSIVHCASAEDIIWGSGLRSADILHLLGQESQYAQLECLAVRGPKTRAGLQAQGCACPEVYGDPGLLFPFLFPEFQRPSQPTRALLIVMHFTEPLLPEFEDHIMFNSEPWHVVIRCSC